MLQPTAQLVGMTGEFAGKQFSVGDSLLIGRVDSADLRIPNLDVSRRHCQIERVEGGFLVTDLGSRSGTRLNDQLIQLAPIRTGDLLTVGPHLFRFELAAEGQPGVDAPLTLVIDDPNSQMTLKELRVSDHSLAKQFGTINESQTLQRLQQHVRVFEEFSKQIETTLDTPVLVERTLDELFRVFSKMDAGVIFLREGETGPLVPSAIRRRRRSDTGSVGYSTTILKFVETEQKAVLSLDVSQDERFQDAVSVKLGSMRTHMCVPLVVRGEVVGAVYLVAEGQDEVTTGFDTEDLSLLSSLAGPVAVCVKNAALAREAQRQARLSSNLQRYVSPDVTRRLIEHGVEGALGARTAAGVAMFCDLVGFTTLSEQLSPDRTARILNRYFRMAIDTVFKHNGSVNKFGGDSFLAVWGAIDPTTNDLSDAVRAALEIQNDTFRLSTELAVEGVRLIQLTIGLNRGRFFAGDIGSDDRMEFTVIGDAVNVAARLQALAHGSQVLTTLESLGDARSRMSLFLYPDTAIRGRTAGVTVASVRSIALSPAGIGTERATSDEVAPDQPTFTPDTKEPLGTRVLASIPIEIPNIGARAVLVSATLGVRIEVDLLYDRPAETDATYDLIPVLPEWDGIIPPTEAISIAAMSEESVHLVRLRLTKPSPELLAMLTPGTERFASRPLRKKT